MNAERLPVDTIRIGTRRRQDLGDIAALAANIERHGLIHPIVVSDDGELIAGERRLRACQSLGWSDIDVRRWRILSEAERHEIELAENLDRKDLTPYERARDLTVLAERAAEVLRSAGEEYLPESGKYLSRGQPAKADAESKVAARINVPQQRIGEARRHVEAATAYPFMQDPSWRQGQVLEAKHHLDQLPEPQRNEAAKLIHQPGIPPQSAVPILANLAAMPQEKREEVFRLGASDDGRDRDLALTTAAKLPAMPDPRLTRLDRAVAELRLAAKAFPDDPFAPRLNEAAAFVRGLADDLRKGAQHADTDGREAVA